MVSANGVNTSAEELNVASACELFRALGSVNRLAIVLELDRGDRCVHELVTEIGISQALASQHLRVLRTAGLVVGKRRGKETVYSLADEHVAHIVRDAVTHGSETLGHPPNALAERPKRQGEEHRT
jgi:ArsR family transcriptional regulator, zinc-responsive transcriptional repressor